MTNHESPGFEDLEPEGTDIEIPGDLGSGEEIETEDIQGFSRDALGEYEFRDLEECEDPAPERDELTGHQPDTSPPSTLARLAARTALKWGSRATAASIVRGRNGRGPVPHTLSFGPAPALEQEYLAEKETDLLDGASAALLEAYELMEALAAVATRADREAEAERFIAAIIPVSIQLAPTVYRALWPAIPALINGTAGVTRLLHRRPSTRPLIRVIPAVLHNSIAQLARYAAHHHPITRQLAAKVLARQTAMVLGYGPGYRPGTYHTGRPRSRSRRPYDSNYPEEWWDDGYGA
jgi:hypothetical protein